jgi:Domain of unknown function (DUF4394)
VGKARVRLTVWSLMVAVALLAATPALARAARAVGVIAPNTLITFDTSSPGSGSFLPISGLGANQTVRGIDVRPADGQLYAVAVTTGSAANSVLSTYRVDPGTGAATFVGATAAALAGGADVPTGWDFNPVVDRIRYVNTNDENARINPTDGALAANDTDLTPAATSTVVAAAYDRNQAGATATTLFAIDRNDSQLALQGGVNGTPSPNGGVIIDIGALGFALSASADAGFDIAPSGIAYAALTSAADTLTRLYTVNLTTGAATAVGPIGIGASEVRSLAILPEPPAPPAPPPTPPAPPAPPDLRPPIVLAVAPQSARLGSVSRRRVAIQFSCNEACTASATLRLGRTVLARGSASLGEASVGRLRLQTTAAQRRAIGRLQRSRTRRRAATLTLIFTDRAGNRRTLTRRLTLSR